MHIVVPLGYLKIIVLNVSLNKFHNMETHLHKMQFQWKKISSNKLFTESFIHFLQNKITYWGCFPSVFICSFVL